MPEVSVIIAVHNGGPYLRQCLDSVVHQTATDIEIICVDDGSTDESRGILESYAETDPRVRVVDGPAIGSAGAARNVGLDRATGEYLSFLDADDFFSPRLLGALTHRAHAHQADVVITKYRSYDEQTGDTVAVDGSLQLDLLPRPPFSWNAAGDGLLVATNPAAWNKLFRTQFVRSLDLRFQELRRTNDAYFTLMALAHAERISYVDDYLITYRTGNTGSLQGSRAKSPLDFVEAIAAMRDKLESSGRLAALERSFVNRAADLCLFNLRNATSLESYREVHRALRSEVLARFGISGRPASYFLRPTLAHQVAALEEQSAEEFLFGVAKAAESASAKARSEARLAWRQAAVMAQPTVREPDAAPGVSASGLEDAVPPVSRPDLSVIVAVYNTADYLRECIASVLAQTNVTIELVAVDDGSTDSSSDILDQLARQDSRLRVFHQANAGLSAARNAGMAVATGRYFCFLDSDDRWEVDAAAALVGQADTQGLDMILFDAISHREPGVDDKMWTSYRGYYERVGGYREPCSGPELFARMVAAEEYRSSACLYLVARSVLQRGDLRFYPGIVREDNLFTFAALLSASRAAHTPLALYGRRVRPGSIMTASSRFVTARGFFISYLEMQRFAAGRRYPPAVATEVGRIIQSMFRMCRDNFVKLDTDSADRFAEIDQSPSGQAAYLILRRLRREARATRTARSLRGAKSAPPAGVFGRARRLLGRAKRFLLGVASGS